MRASNWFVRWWLPAKTCAIIVCMINSNKNDQNLKDKKTDVQSTTKKFRVGIQQMRWNCKFGVISDLRMPEKLKNQRRKKISWQGFDVQRWALRRWVKAESKQSRDRKRMAIKNFITFGQKHIRTHSASTRSFRKTNISAIVCRQGRRCREMWISNKWSNSIKGE